MNCTNNGGPPPVLYWAILKVVEEEKWKVDLRGEEKEMMKIKLKDGAKRGYLGKVILESRCGGKFDKNAMDWAAMKGHLDMVIWLHENRTEGCSKWAMD